MSNTANGDNDNYDSAAVNAAKANAWCTQSVPTDTEIARFGHVMAVFSVTFLALALTAALQPKLNDSWYVTVCFSMGILYMVATGCARELKMQQLMTNFCPRDDYAE